VVDGQFLFTLGQGADAGGRPRGTVPAQAGPREQLGRLRDGVVVPLEASDALRFGAAELVDVQLSQQGQLRVLAGRVQKAYGGPQPAVVRVTAGDEPTPPPRGDPFVLKRLRGATLVVIGFRGVTLVLNGF
jgi:hypothetical protein